MSRPRPNLRPIRDAGRTPTRTCVACRTERDKQALVRIVRGPDGLVRLDPTGKGSGRGAYLCADPVCWSKALKTRAVQRALEVASSEDLSTLLAAGPPNRGAATEAIHGA